MQRKKIAIKRSILKNQNLINKVFKGIYNILHGIFTLNMETKQIFKFFKTKFHDLNSNIHSSKLKLKIFNQTGGAVVKRLISAIPAFLSNATCI